MSDWIHIEPSPQVLTPNQKRIKEMLDAGKSIWQIALILHMGEKAVREEIYEIRKKESIMGKKPKFNKTERAELLRLHNEERYSVGKLAAKYSCSQTAIKTALNAAKIEAEEEPRKTQINAEFDAAVDVMITESKEADAEKRSAIADSEPEQLEDCEDGIPNTPLATQPAALPKLPDYVVRAIRLRMIDIEEDIECRQQRISELQQEIADLCIEYDNLNAWRDKYASNED